MTDEQRLDTYEEKLHDFDKRQNSFETYSRLQMQSMREFAEEYIRRNDENIRRQEADMREARQRHEENMREARQRHEESMREARQRHEENMREARQRHEESMLEAKKRHEEDMREMRQDIKDFKLQHSKDIAKVEAKIETLSEKVDKIADNVHSLFIASIIGIGGLIVGIGGLIFAALSSR